MVKSPDDSCGVEADKLFLEKQRLELDQKKLIFELLKQKQDHLDRRGAVTNQYAQQAQRAVLLINGAAAIATLTFIGNRQPSLADAETTVIGAVLFSAGVAAAAASAVISYYARISDKGKRPKLKRIYALEGAAGISGIIALLLFPCGASMVGLGILGVSVIQYIR